MHMITKIWRGTFVAHSETYYLNKLNVNFVTSKNFDLEWVRVIMGDQFFGQYRSSQQRYFMKKKSF